MKKAQVTIFIILGLILLIGAAIAYYAYQQQAITPIRQVPTAPEEVQKVHDYITTCINQLSKEALNILGAQGGYLQIPPLIERNPNAHLKADTLGILKIPYWYYEGEDRTPTTEYIQKSISQHIQQNIKNCANLNAFQPEYEITEKTTPFPIITITDDQVITELKWTLEIKTAGKQITLTDYATNHNIKLKEILNLATKTIQTENKQAWFENLTINLMSANPKIPLSGIEIKCAPRKWHIETIKKELQQTLYYNLPLIRVTNTDNPPTQANPIVYQQLKQQAQEIRDQLEADKAPKYPEPPIDAYEVNSMTLNVGTPQTQLKTAFQYHPEYGMLLTAKPNQAGTLSTANIKGNKKYLSFLCIQQWHYTYDIIYPILNTIRDDTAFNGEGYIFQYAFPILIQDNAQNRKAFGQRKFTIPDTGTDYCETQGKQIDIRTKGYIEGIPIPIELDNINITYECANQQCNLGQTHSDGTGIIRLNTYIPEGCSNPTIIATAERYLQAQTKAQEKTELTLTKLKTLNYTIKIHPYYEEADKTNPTISKNAQWLETTNIKNDTPAIITLELRNQPYQQYKAYPTDTTIQLPLETAQYDIDLAIFKGDTQIGGYNAENITITYDQLIQGNTIEFNVIEYRPTPIQGYEQAAMYTFIYDRGTKDGEPLSEALRPTIK